MPELIMFSSHDLLLPVIKNLKDDFTIGTLDGRMGDILKNLDIASEPLTKVMTPELKDFAFTAAAHVIHDLVEFKGYEERVGVGAAKFLTNKFSAFAYSRMADLSLFVLALDIMKPHMLVLHNDVEPMTRTAALWAKARGIKCLHVPHAVYQDGTRSSIGTDVHDLVTASNLAVAGPYQRAWYEKRGMSAFNVKETGLPQWDKWAEPQKDKARACRLLKLKDYIPTITYIGTWRQNTNMFGCNDSWAQVYVEFLDAVKKIETPLQVIVKTHPNAGNESLNWHASVAKENKVKCLVTSQYLDLVLLASDLVIAPYASNVLIEAATMPHLRLMTMEGDGFHDDDVIIKAQHDKLVESIIEALQGEPKNSKEFLAKYMGLVDGKAHVRVADYVRELAL